VFLSKILLIIIARCFRRIRGYLARDCFYMAFSDYSSNENFIEGSLLGLIMTIHLIKTSASGLYRAYYDHSSDKIFSEWSL